MPDSVIGFGAIAVAGVISGSFTLPMKFTRSWAWENTWLVWTLLALVLLPTGMAVANLPHIGEVYARVDPRLLATIVTLGVFWGVTQVLFGLAVDAIGMALAFAIVPGVSAALGSLIPLVRFHHERLLRADGVSVMVGVALIAVGVTLCASAGWHRSVDQAAVRIEPKRRYVSGLALALSSGLGASMLNIGLAFGGPLLESAQQMGADAPWAPNAVWLPIMLGGAIPNTIYCIHRLRTNRTGARFVDSGTAACWLYALVMAAFWFGSISLYGVAVGRLGNWGTVVGWPVFTSVLVVTASISGIATGEWRDAGRRSLELQCGGVAVLVAAVFVLAAASRFV